jgi:hypothetical protein
MGMNLVRPVPTMRREKRLGQVVAGLLDQFLDQATPSTK